MGFACTLCARRNLRLNSWLPTLCPAFLWCLSQPLQRSPGFIFWLINWDLLCASNTTRIIYPPKHPVQFGNLIYMKCTKMGTIGGRFSIKNGLPFVLAEHTFRLCIHGLQTIIWINYLFSLPCLLLDLFICSSILSQPLLLFIIFFCFPEICWTKSSLLYANLMLLKLYILYLVYLLFFNIHNLHS